MESRPHLPVDFEASINMAPPQKPFLCRYRNWECRTDYRAILPNHFWYGSTSWHPKPGLLLNGTDLTTQKCRDFSVSDFDISTLELFPHSCADLTETEATTAIIRERLRQIRKEGWSSVHDDQYCNGELYAAAEIYHSIEEGDAMPNEWPWDPAWFKPRSAIENLTRAGALVMADRALSIRRHESTRRSDKLLRIIVVDLSAFLLNNKPEIIVE